MPLLHLGITTNMQSKYPTSPSPADTKHNIYIVFMLEGYVKIMLDFILECLVFFNVKILMLYFYSTFSLCVT